VTIFGILPFNPLTGWLMEEPNIPDKPNIPDLIALLRETLEQIKEVHHLSSNDSSLIELQRQIVTAIAEVSVSRSRT